MRPPLAHTVVDEALTQWLMAYETPWHICVAYSGGVDSSVLLHALAHACRQIDKPPGLPQFTLSAIHIHHGLSPNANTWAEHCERNCLALGVPLHIVRVQVTDAATHGIEAAARNARYHAFAHHAHELTNLHDAPIVITLAHHARDQAESLLLQLLRGAGPQGLAAMPAQTNHYARPLLNVQKADIDAYAVTHFVAHITDESNDDTRFARNRLRKTVWPTLISAFPDAEKTLARAARWQHESAHLSAILAEQDLETCCTQDHHTPRLHLTPWRLLDSARRRNVLRAWLDRLNCPTQAADRLLDWERQLVSSGNDQAVELRHASLQGTLRQYRQHLYFVPNQTINMGTLQAQLAQLTWQGEETLNLPHGNISAKAVFTAENKALTFVYEKTYFHGKKLTIRLRQPYDLISSSPSKNGDSLKEVFQRSGIPTWQRATWPLLTTEENRVIAVIGLAVDHRFQGELGEPALQLFWNPDIQMMKKKPTA